MEIKSQAPGSARTLAEVMDRGALECTEERERYLAIFTVGHHGYVCRNEAATDEGRALFKGTYRECQVWIERRGISAALKYVQEHLHEVPELADRSMTASEMIALLARLPQ